MKTSTKIGIPPKLSAIGASFLTTTVIAHFANKRKKLFLAENYVLNSCIRSSS